MFVTIRYLAIPERLEVGRGGGVVNDSDER
jgi:anthranilate/para-aminobenzoate synthase component I